jgi:multicomponent Na+:H+ antiporter subunit F
MNTVSIICFVLLGCSASLTVLRVLRSGSLPERVVSMDATLTVLANVLAVYAAKELDTLASDLVLYIGLLAFIGTAAAAEFTERRGAR